MNKIYIVISVIISVALVISAFLFFLATRQKELSKVTIYNTKLKNLEQCLSGADNRYNFAVDAWFENNPGQTMPGQHHLYLIENNKEERKNCYSTFSK